MSFQYAFYSHGFWIRYGKAMRGFTIRFGGQPLFSERNKLSKPVWKLGNIIVVKRLEGL